MMVQIVFVFAFMNLQVSSIVREYHRLSFAEETGERIHIYENSMVCLMENNWGKEQFQKAAGTVLSMDGVKEIGYQAGLYCSVNGYGDEHTEIFAYYLSPPVHWIGRRRNRWLVSWKTFIKMEPQLLW